MALMRDRYNNAYYPQRRIGFQDPRQDYPEGDPPYMAARRRRRADGTFMGMDDGRQQYDDGMDRRDPGMRREVYDNISTMPRRYRAPIRNTYDERNHRPNMSMGSQNRDHDAMIGGFWLDNAKNHKMPPLTRDEAEEWVAGMESDDRNQPRGGMYSFEDARQIAEERGMKGEQEQIDFFVALNMVASDYGEALKKNGADTEDALADMAEAFLFDRDGPDPSEKLAAYHKIIALKEQRKHKE